MNFRRKQRGQLDYVYLVDRFIQIRPTRPTATYADVKAHSDRLHVAFNHSEPRTRHPHIGDPT